MFEFLRRNRVLLAAAAFLLLAAGLVLSSNPRGRSDGLGRVLLEVMAPFQRASSAVVELFTSGWRRLASFGGTGEEVRTLHGKLETLQQQVDRLAEVELENARLRALLDFRGALRGELLTAQIIGYDVGQARTLLIDRGEADGVTKGRAVLAPQGIVGQVFQASGHAARVLLISDHNSGVDAVVQRTRAHGIVQGTLEGGCGLKYVKRTEDVQVGDLVVTSGLDGIFPKGLPVGAVTAIDKGGQGLFQNAEVVPRVDFGRLEEVLVALAAVEPVEPVTPVPLAPGD